MKLKPLAIGVLARGIDDYYYGAMLNGIREVCRAAGMPLLVIYSGISEDLPLPPFGAEHVAGWIVLHPMPEDRAKLAALVACGVPVVSVATVLDDVACASVSIDNRGATHALVSHLIDHGHRHIACIDHGPDTWGRARYQGYLDALQQHGIALDSAWVLDTSHIVVDVGDTGALVLRQAGEHAARQLIAQGMPCTALVAGTDLSALAAMQALWAAGYRVPEDVAVVGFDDIAEAQYAQPPLTTVRTRFDQFGQVAAEELLAVLHGERDMQPRRIYAPPSLVCRRSCGCAGVEEIQAQGAAAVATASDWQSALAKQLATLISYPLAPSPDTPPEQLWPGIYTLVAAVEAALQGQESSMRDMELAWQQAVAITENQELLNAAVALLEDLVERLLSGAPVGARPQSIALFRELRVAMLRARLTYEARKNENFTQSGIINQNISTFLLSSRVGESQSLDWLDKTLATWGCLALWDAPPSNTPTTLSVVGVYQRDGASGVAIGARYAGAEFPPFELLPSFARQGHDLTILAVLRAGTDELGVLALCGFAEQDFSIPTAMLTDLPALLGATLRRDELITSRDALIARLKDQALELAQARDVAEAANRAKSIFLSNMSHELRTPLNGILGYAQILKRKHLDNETVNGLNIIERSGEHLLTLINDILDLAKIEAGWLELHPIPVHLPAFLNSIVEIIRARAEMKQLSISFEPPPDLPERVQADETRLRQVLLNLLGNAVKFTDQGRVTLNVRLAGHQPLATGQENQEPHDSKNPDADSGSRKHEVLGSGVCLSIICFEVEDTGIGIAPDQLERIFQPFEQVSEQSRQVEGTGLGLAISRQLVRLMGGELHVESETGRGSTFWFQVSLPLTEAVVPTGQSHQRMISGYSGARRTILVVDDIASNRVVLTGMLQPLGFMVLEAEDGRQAIELAQQAPPDLILMDLYMPVLSGVEALRQIRALPELGGIPIIATSASVAAADQALSRKAGHDDFLPKPIHLSQLVAMLERHLQLEWVYAAVQEAAEAVEMLVPPPQEELAALGTLVAIGDILALQERVAELEQRDPHSRAFAHELARLASQFELERLRALLNEYLPTETQLD